MSALPTGTIVLLYGRSSFDRSQNVAALCGRLTGRLGDVEFHAAYEDLTGPSLPELLTTLAARNPARVLVVPCAIPADPTMSTWLAGALSAWREQNGAALDLRITPPVEAFLDLDAAILAACSAPAERHRQVVETAPSMGKPGWSQIPEHGRQIFFCLGARCAHRGALPLYQHLRKRMKSERALTAGPRRVMCARSTCLYPCNLGPLMIVHQDGVWYGGFDEAGIARIVSEHLIEGRVVDELVVHVQPQIAPNVADKNDQSRVNA